MTQSDAVWQADEGFDSEKGWDPTYFVEPDEMGVPTKPGRFTSVHEVKSFMPVEGAVFHPILGEDMLLNYIVSEPNSPLTIHAHAEEQIFICLEGEIEFVVGDEKRMLKAGDVAVIPPWVPHGGGTRDKGMIGIDVFSPPRKQLKEFVESE
ncbi:MAG: cupin domain-containing protein [Propionibacteriaceae bacterium]|jgi:quercetin dioxygenase-like cupin family protein|nr:cupin domain-containing protein [Propionibacteriaceae bacterium]